MYTGQFRLIMTTEQDARLIALVGERPYLYNGKETNRQKIDNSWLEISLQMGLTSRYNH